MHTYIWTEAGAAISCNWCECKLAVGFRSHSRLQNIEFECWVFKGAIAKDLESMGIEKDNAYFSRVVFNPKTLQPLS